jgi:hypothetical protein
MKSSSYEGQRNTRNRIAGSIPAPALFLEECRHGGIVTFNLRDFPRRSTEAMGYRRNASSGSAPISLRLIPGDRAI